MGIDGLVSEEDMSLGIFHFANPKLQRRSCHVSSLCHQTVIRRIGHNPNATPSTSAPLLIRNTCNLIGQGSSSPDDWLTDKTHRPRESCTSGGCWVVPLSRNGMLEDQTFDGLLIIQHRPFKCMYVIMIWLSLAKVRERDLWALSCEMDGENQLQNDHSQLWPWN